MPVFRLSTCPRICRYLNYLLPSRNPTDILQKERLYPRSNGVLGVWTSDNGILMITRVVRHVSPDQHYRFPPGSRSEVVASQCSDSSHRIALRSLTRFSRPHATVSSVAINISGSMTANGFCAGWPVCSLLPTNPTFNGASLGGPGTNRIPERSLSSCAPSRKFSGYVTAPSAEMCRHVFCADLHPLITEGQFL